jgi:hypothetical protein
LKLKSPISDEKYTIEIEAESNNIKNSIKLTLGIELFFVSHLLGWFSALPPLYGKCQTQPTLPGDPIKKQPS